MFRNKYNKEKLHTTTKEINSILQVCENIKDCNLLIPTYYTKLTPKTTDVNNKKYSIGDILKNKIIKTIQKEYINTGIVIQLIEYKSAPYGFVILANFMEKFKDIKNFTWLPLSSTFFECKK